MKYILLWKPDTHVITVATEDGITEVHISPEEKSMFDHITSEAHFVEKQ